MTTESSIISPLAGNRTAHSASARVARFTRTERAVHWVQAISFLALMITGFALSISGIERIFGHRALLREIHLSSAFFFAFGPLVVGLAGDRRSVAADVASVDTWDADDLRWLLPSPVLRLMHVSPPAQGRFNAGQKLNAIFVVWCVIVFTVTGVIIWQNRRFPSDLVSRANTIHTLLAYLALGAFLGHLYLATGDRRTRHSFRAITQGWVNRSWAEHHHAKWVQSLGSAMLPPRYDGLRTTVQIVLGSAIACFSTRILFFAIGANTTDKVTDRLYSLTAWPGVAGVQPQTGVRIADWPSVGYVILCLIAWLLVDRLRRLPASAASVSSDGVA